jgi:RNA polymerase sigma-70 factor, ECF subfamily
MEQAAPSISGRESPSPDSRRQTELLVAACARGERAAFRELFLLYQHRVYSIALHYTADPTAAMDIAQDVFLKLHAAIRSFRGESAFETWLFRMVANCCHDRHRKLRKLVPLEEQQLPAPRDQATEQAQRNQVSRQVQHTVAALPEELRMTVVLRYTEGLSYDEIAAVLGVPQGTIASRLNRAHRELAVRLEHLKEGV